MKKNEECYVLLRHGIVKLLRIMRLTFLIILIGLMKVSASVYSQQSKLSMNIHNVSLKEALSTIEDQSKFVFFYNADQIELDQRVTVEADNQGISEILADLFQGKEIAYKIADRRIVLYPQGSSSNLIQQEKITGKVTESSGQVLPGVSIVIKGTTTGTITDFEGNFALANVSEDATLIFSFVGMKMQEILVAGQSTFNISMEEDAIGIDEVVAIGYGSMKKSDLTGSIASVSSDDLGEVATDAFSRALGGKIAGVHVQQTTGTPGGNLTIRIRGAGSLSAGNEPLYVIDGFPVQQGSISASDQGFNPLSSINPDDIETIQVLKDASACAIYGSRGANGVVLITTKSGKAGDTKLSFSSSVGVQSVINKMELLNSDQYLDFVRDAYDNADATSSPGIAYPDFLSNESQYRGIDTDWQDQIFRPALVQNYQLSATGGSDDFQYFLSGSYLNEEGIVLSSGFERFSLRSNITTQLTEKLKLGINFTPSYTINDEVRAEGHWAGNNVINQSLINFPFLRPDESSEVFVNNDPNYTCCGVPNPVQTAQDFDATSTQFRILSTVYLEAELAKGLKFKTNIGVDLSEWERNEFFPAEIKQNNNSHSAKSVKLSRKSWLSENTLTYVKNIHDHSFNVLGGFTYQEYREQNNTIKAKALTNDIIHTINDFNTVNSASSTIEQWSLVSYLARLNYSYKNKYLFTATVRSDGSSRFGANSRYATFPSISVGWVLSEEEFMKGIDKISRLKLRASHGKGGNNNIGNYSSIGLLSSSDYVFGTGNGNAVSGLYADNIGNPDLTWETTIQSDFGMEVGLLKNRIYLTMDYYKGETEGLLLDVPIPTSSGFDSALQNLGRIENKGVELSIDSKNFEGAFKWNTDFNISFNRNKILELGPEGDPIRAGSGAGKVYLNEVGGELASYWVYEQIGIFQNQDEIDNSATYNTSRGTYPGDVKYKDQNDDGVINSDDKVVIGSNNPDFTWGLTNTFAYNNFDLRIVMNGVQGNLVHNVARRFYNNLEGNQNQSIDALNRWRSESEPGDGVTPRANRLTSGQSNKTESSRWMEDGSFVRIQDVTLGYNVPVSMSKRINLSKVRIYGAVSNLAYFTKYTGYNPEVSANGGDPLSKGSDYGSYPLSRRFTVGVKVTF